MHTFGFTNTRAAESLRMPVHEHTVGALCTVLEKFGDHKERFMTIGPLSGSRS